MTNIREVLKGKKTYICAGALAAVAILGFLFGYVDGAQATAMLMTAGGLAGLGAKSQRAAEATMAALTEVHYAQNQARLAHKPLDAKQLAADVARTVAPQVIAAVTQQIPVAGTSVVGTATAQESATK
jgi:hypothetical protein